MRLDIDGDRGTVTFIDADDLWGKGTYATQAALDKKKYHAVIGPAGENQVRYAGIVSDERIAGRTGVGAVMGSKRLKAISVNGSRKLEMDDEEKFKAYTKWVREMFRDHPVLGEHAQALRHRRHRQHHQRPQHHPDAQLQVRPLQGRDEPVRRVHGGARAGRGQVELHPLPGDLRP